jgi:hypothetical protein
MGPYRKIEETRRRRGTCCSEWSGLQGLIPAASRQTAAAFKSHEETATMPTYRQADKDVMKIIKELFDQHHEELAEAGVRVGCLFAYAPKDENTGEPKGPALKLHGWPCAAIVKIVAHKDRVAGMPDAMICVDGKAWEEDWNENRQRAVLDHELTHIEVCRDEDGAVKLDDCHRPKLKMRPDDWNINGFQEIAQRYKEDSIEVGAARAMADKYGQLLFPW